MLVILLAALAAGFLTKFTDLIVDKDIKADKRIAYVTGPLYGLAIAYVMTTEPSLAPLGVALTLAVIITRKIDRLPHTLGIAALAAGLVAMGFHGADVLQVAVFLLAGIGDEIGNSLADKGKIKGIPAKLLKSRLMFIEPVAFAVSLLTGQWIIFSGIVCFDAAYQMTTRFARKSKQLK
ncbi:MAG: hypothetical protein NTU57_05340 [Candidatus Aenigmarchaeota archaeon]|nr:hypothetical protein [Candidatus Aenigmarchaeota archaeon]